MKNLNKELEVLKFIDSSIFKSLDGLEHNHIIILGGHSVQSLMDSTQQMELIDIITNLVINRDLIQVTREEDTFSNGKLYKKHYYTLTKQGKFRLRSFYIRFPSNLWSFLKSDGYVILSIISTFLSIVSIVIAFSRPVPQQKSISSAHINQEIKTSDVPSASQSAAQTIRQ